MTAGTVSGLHQNEAYAQRYASFVEKVVSAEIQRIGSVGELTNAVADSLFKLMAY
jgi:hypothetical protein